MSRIVTDEVIYAEIPIDIRVHYRISISTTEVDKLLEAQGHDPADFPSDLAPKLELAMEDSSVQDTILEAWGSAGDRNKLGQIKLPDFPRPLKINDELLEPFECHPQLSDIYLAKVYD